jgi:hypothetical protein
MSREPRAATPDTRRTVQQRYHLSDPLAYAVSCAVTPCGIFPTAAVVQKRELRYVVLRGDGWNEDARHLGNKCKAPTLRILRQRRRY